MIGLEIEMCVEIADMIGKQTGADPDPLWLWSVEYSGNFNGREARCMRPALERGVPQVERWEVTSLARAARPG